MLLACSAVEIVLALVIVAIVAWFVTGPLRRSEGQAEAAEAELEDPAIAEIEARKEAKYREIRDAELDRRQGKLSEADWRRQDAELRREAIEILKRPGPPARPAMKRRSPRRSRRRPFPTLPWRWKPCSALSRWSSRWS